MDNLTEPVTAEHIIAVYDLTNFIKISKENPPERVFRLLDTLQRMSIGAVKDRGARVIKNIGDACLMIMTPEDADGKIRALWRLKEEMELFLKDSGCDTTTSFSCHVGEVTVGPLGVPPYETVDAFGDAINTVFIMNGKPFKGRFVITSQLFRRLDGESRKSFHKYTPPICYMAER